jgi:hypothetical protein
MPPREATSALAASHAAIRRDTDENHQHHTGEDQAVTLTKTAKRAVNSRISTLRAERRKWLAGRYTHWGEPWCAGPGSSYHQEPCCEGCATVAWCRDRAAEISEQITDLAASLVPAVQGALW